MPGISAPAGPGHESQRDRRYPLMSNEMTTEMTPELRRRNVRTAWLLAAFAAFMLLTSIPFWKGLANMIAASGL